MEPATRQLYLYLLDEVHKGINSIFARDMVCNILAESEKISNISERCEWLAKMFCPNVSIKEIRDILLR